MAEQGIPGIEAIDTRALTKKLRVRGALNGFISTREISAEEAIERAKTWPGLTGVDYVKTVTHAKAFLWDETDTQSQSFHLPYGAGATGTTSLCRRQTFPSSLSTTA